MKYECSALAQFPGLQHSFFAGFPSGFSPNEGVIEGPESQPLPVITLKQVHGKKVWKAEETQGQVLEGDGLVTHGKNIALGILTADCGPVLFYEPLAEVIGACHAGWRGACGGIIQETLQSMVDLGAQYSQIYATLGPTIQQENYEVGPEFLEEVNLEYETYFYPSPKPGHHYFNLPKYIKKIIVDQGITNVHDLGLNTFSGAFASRRRALSEGRKGFLNNLSLIAMT